MKVAILDDYQDVFRTLKCYPRLKGHEVVVVSRFREGAGEAGGAAERRACRAPAAAAHAVPARRGRAGHEPEAHQPDRAQRESHRRRGVHREGDPGVRRRGRASQPYGGADLGPYLLGAAPHPRGGAALKGGQVADHHRHHGGGQNARHLRLRPHRQHRRRRRPGVRHARRVLGARGLDGKGARRRLRDRGKPRGVLRDRGHREPAPSAQQGDARHRETFRPRAHEADRAHRQYQPRADHRGRRAGESAEGRAARVRRGGRLR